MAYKQIADFRSDTVTRPNQSMYSAMLNAELGDDCFGDDPTVLQLEKKCAQLTGKEAALLFPSGTMANQTAVRTHCLAGQEVIVEEDSHILNYEMGGLAYAMVQVRPIKGYEGAIEPCALQAKLYEGDSHRPATGLVCLENPHNLAGGVIIVQERVVELSDIAHQHGVPVHLDGARIFNIQVATGKAVSELSAPVDSVMFCLSKGLGAPIGSVLCGSSPFIQKARGVRQFMGGAMRQAGIVAACGLEAVSLSNINSLDEDHRRTKELARCLATLPHIKLLNPSVDTNMLYLGIEKNAPFNAHDLVVRAKEANVLLVNLDASTIRVVCHKDVDDEDVARLVSLFTKWCK
jgi:threonine aldolase